MPRRWQTVDISELIGKTLVSIDGDKGSDELIFTAADGTRYRQHHDQDCCESVNIEDICGDLSDLIGTPILDAREDTNAAANTPGVLYPRFDGGTYTDESFTWTFYNFQTAKGHVTIRWYGVSNGYYSESVDFQKEADNA
jgi:hypothetical protein